MTYISREVIRRVLMTELELASKNHVTFAEVGQLDEAEEWGERARAAEYALAEFDNKYLDDSYRAYCDAERVKQLLRKSYETQGANITITVQRDDGDKDTAVLYDHAALVQGLIDALDYFQSEL